MNLLHQAALNYLKLGLSTIPTNSNKQSISAWKQFQNNLPTEQQLQIGFSNPKATGLAVICGAVSNGLEVIDVDCKYGVNFDDYLTELSKIDKSLTDKLLIIKTKSNGYHIYYRCEIIEGNQKLAMRPATDDEKFANPNVTNFVLIETRGEGGYVIAPPTEGYTNIQGKNIPIVTIDERDILLSTARKFNKIIEEVKQPNLPNNNDKLTVWDDFNQRCDIIPLLEKHGWTVAKVEADKTLLKRPGQTSQLHSAVFFHDKRIFYPHTTSTSFQNKGYNPFGVYVHLECNDDYKKAVKQLSGTYGIANDEGWFWSYNRNGAVTINRYDLLQWLYDNYVQLYFHDKRTGSYRLVNEQDKKIEEIYPENIKKFIKHQLEKANHTDVIEALVKQSSSLFNDHFFEFLEASNAEILRDTKDHCYFPFNNAIVNISKNEIKLISYPDIHQSIWTNQINDFNIKLLSDYNPKSSKYSLFIRKISADDEARVKYAESLIGYVLHSYKDPSKPFAPILAEETDDEAKGGGTGKGIFFQAIGKLIPVVRIDGKNFRPDKTFAFQRVGLGTKLVVIEDCPKNVDFEKYYPTITEGMTIERKNQDEVFLKYNESPKIAFTTNYTIANTAEHAKRRQRVLEFAPFFNSKFTPMDFFGETMFTDWDNDEMQLFYNYLFYCVQLYLVNGVMTVDNSDKLRRKQIKMQFGEEFLEYWEQLEKDKIYLLSDEWKSFLLRNEMDKKDYSLKRFTKGLKIGSEIMGIGYIGSENRQNNNLKQFTLVDINKNNNEESEKSAEKWQNVTDLDEFLF